MYHEVSVDRKTTCQSCQSESCARQRTPGTGEGCLRRPSTELMAPPVSGATQAVHHLPLARIFHHQKISKETLPEFLEFIGIQLLDKHRTGFFCWTVLPGLLFVFDYSQVKNCQTRAILPTQPAVATGAVPVPQADVSNALQPAIGEWFDTAKLDQNRKTWISCRLATSLQRTTLNICCNKYLQYFAICQYVDSVESSTIFSTCHFCLGQLVEASAQHARSTQAAIGVLEGRCQVWASVNHFVLTCIDIIPNHPASIKIDDKYDNDIDDQYDNDIDDQYDHECLFEKVQYRSCWKVPASTFTLTVTTAAANASFFRMFRFTLPKSSSRHLVVQTWHRASCHLPKLESHHCHHLAKSCKAKQPLLVNLQQKHHQDNHGGDESQGHDHEKQDILRQHLPETAVLLTGPSDDVCCSFCCSLPSGRVSPMWIICDHAVGKDGHQQCRGE